MPMSRHRLRFVVPTLPLAVLATLLAAAPAQQDREIRPKRPNVLVILADDLGYSDLGCFGSEIPTPTLDALAANGLRYTQAYTSARCCPTRASLLTGLHPHQAGIGSFATAKPHPTRGPAYLGRLNDRCVTLAEVLKAAGYGTYMVGKWHVGRETGPIERGFDEFYGFRDGYEQDQWQPRRYERLPEGRTLEIEVDGTGDERFYATDKFTEQALVFLDQAQQKDEPWFLYLAHSAPHFPVQAPKASVDALVSTYRQGWDTLRAERFRKMRASGLADDTWTLTARSLVPVDKAMLTDGYAGQPNPAWLDLPENRREDLARRMAVFAAMVSHVDRGVGQIVEKLVQTGQLDDTLIVFLSDNGACYEWGPFGFDGPSRRGGAKLHEGEDLANMGGPDTYHAYGSAWSNLCNTPFRLYKHFAHEGGIAVPMVAHWPNGIVQKDRWVRDPVHVMDLMPTLCDVAGAEYPEARDGTLVQPTTGISLVPTFAGETLPERTLCFEHQEARAVRRGRYKAVWGKRMPQEPSWELYDLEADRCETNDLAAEQPERTAQLAEAWRRWAEEVGVHPFWQRAQQRPNVILIMADDLGMGMLGHYGQRIVTTPNIDRLAREGIAFSNYHGCAFCAPARASLLSGLHDGREGIGSHTAGGFVVRLDREVQDDAEWQRRYDAHIRERSQAVPIADDELFLAQVARLAGYRTAQFGKLDAGFLTWHERLTRHGWEHYVGYYDHVRAHGFYPTYLWKNGNKLPLPGNTAADAGKQSERGREPVGQGGATYSQDVFLREILDYLRDHRANHADERFFLYHSTQLPHGPVATPSLHRDFAQRDDLTLSEKKYASMVKMLDDHVGRILQELEDLDLADETMIFFSSDNGHETYYENQQGLLPKRNTARLLDGTVADHGANKWRTSNGGDSFDGAAGMANLKWSTFEGGIRCPMFVRMPGVIPAGVTTDRLTTHYDFLATLADIVGWADPRLAEKDGRSYYATLRGLPDAGHDDVFIRGRRIMHGVVIDRDGWKYCRFKDGTEQLYSLSEDHFERHDVLAEQPEVLARLRTVFDREYGRR